MKNIPLICVIGISALLSGCGQEEPTEAEINNTLKASFEEANAQISQSVGVSGSKLLDSMKVKFISGRKISCEESEQKVNIIVL